MNEHGYLIFKSGGGYYCEGAKGYTLNADEAGRFSRLDAVSYSHPNGPNGPRDGITFKHESEVLSGSSCEKTIRIQSLEAERNMLWDAREELTKELSLAHKKIDYLEARKHGAEFAADVFATVLDLHTH